MADDDGEFSALFRGEYPRVLRAMTLVLYDRGEAEDVVQDAFAQLYRHWRRVSRYDRPDAWVRTVAMRLAFRRLRREQLRWRLERDAADGPYLLDADVGARLDVVDAVRSLPPKQRAVVTLFYLEDRPMEEVAAIVGCRPSTGWVHLHKARRALAPLLSERVTDDVR